MERILIIKLLWLLSRHGWLTISEPLTQIPMLADYIEVRL